MYSPTIELDNQKLEKNKIIVASDKKYRSQLLKRFKRDDIRSGPFFRDLALFLEHYEMHKVSLFFMGKAKMYSPNLKPVDSTTSSPYSLEQSKHTINVLSAKASPITRTFSTMSLAKRLLHFLFINKP